MIITALGLFGASAFISSSDILNPPQDKPAFQQITPDSNKSQKTKPSMVFTSSTPTWAPRTALRKSNIVLARVIKVIDGDTIEVDLGNGNVKTVRYIGIDTPETNDPRKPVQCFSREAAAKNKELVENGIVGLEKDISETDKYGRLLRYVYVGDLFVNRVLVVEGYATVVSYPPDIKYQDKLQKAEQQARAEGRGLWGTCRDDTSSTVEGAVVSNSASTQIKTNQAGGTCKYSCSGTDKDCSDFTSQGEAQTFFNCCSFTATNDPMRLDNVGVGDGIACESLP